MSIKIDLENIVEGSDDATNFTSCLLRLIFKADQMNKASLRCAFPAEVRAVETYQETGEITGGGEVDQ